MLIDSPLGDLLQAFSSPEPTPGGGSASALAGAVGTSLLVMVCVLPKTRNSSEEDRAALADAAGDLERLRDSLAVLIDRDSRAYEAVVAAYRMPRKTEDEKAARKAGVQAALREATDVPLQVMRDCAAAAALGTIVAAHGIRAAASDVGVGMVLIDAGLHGAMRNVETNLKGIQDAAYVEGVRVEAAALANEVEVAAAIVTGDRT